MRRDPFQLHQWAQLCLWRPKYTRKRGPTGTGRVPRGPSPLPVPLLAVQGPAVPSAFSCCHPAAVSHNCTRLRHWTRSWPGWDHSSTQRWPRTPTKQAPIPKHHGHRAAAMVVPCPGGQEAKVPSVRPHPPAEHQPKDAEPLLSPRLSLTSVQMPKLGWRHGSRGSSGTGMRQCLWREVAGGDTSSSSRPHHPQPSAQSWPVPMGRLPPPSKPGENPTFIKTQFIPNIKRLQFFSSLPQLINQNTLHFLFKKIDLF